jgi:hypothetical protein
LVYGRAGTYEVADCELCEDEIQSRFGHLIEGALRAFTHDMTYLVEMAEHANRIVNKRKMWQARRDAQAQGA